ncbi:hypothetical protein, partial [Catalinimonas alkaloidigena]|uniref:hypothetical protein n=1 Tax=Catalinimonas alkaloidigena TaxID=1075417 RepID=UPI001C40978B
FACDLSIKSGCKTSNLFPSCQPLYPKIFSLAFPPLPLASFSVEGAAKVSKGPTPAIPHFKKM